MISLSQPTSGSGAAWGSITGTISAQTDLQTALDAKVPLTSFTGGGTLATAGYTLTLPATGTAALLGTANVFTALQTITQGTANAGILASTGYSLTGSNATSMIDLAGTWNTTGAPTAIKLNITRTAAAATSLLMDLQQGGVSAFNVLSNSAGNTKISFGLRGASIDTTDDYGTGLSGYFGNIIKQNTAGIACVGVSNFSIGTNADALLARKAAAVIQLGLDAAGVTNQMLTAASRITSDGVGADLTIAGGNGRGGAGGSLILSTYDTEAAGTPGNLRTRIILDTAGNLTIPNGLQVVIDTSTGTTWGMAADQKQSWWGATPVVQPTTGGATASFANNTGTPVLEDSTWDGYTISVVIAALRNIGILA